MWENIWFACIGMVTVYIFYTDCRYYWIPDRAIALLVLLHGAAWYGGMIQPQWSTVLGVSVTFCLLWCWKPQGIGTGDIKLAMILSCSCMGREGVLMLWSAFFSALVCALIVWRCKGEKMIPFAPFLLCGWWFAKWEAAAILIQPENL